MLREKRVAIIVVVTIFAIVLLVLILRGSNDSSNGVSIFTDPGSGETVVDIEGKDPEVADIDEQFPDFFGLTDLNKRGLTSAQISLLRFAFLRFDQSTDYDIDAVSIVVDTIERKSRDRGEPTSNQTQTTTFDVLINRNETYSAAIQSTSIDDLSLTLNDGSNVIFDSGALFYNDYFGLDVSDPPTFDN